MYVIGELDIPQFNLFVESSRCHWVQNLSAWFCWNKYFISSSSEGMLRKDNFLWAPEHPGKSWQPAVWSSAQWLLQKPSLSKCSTLSVTCFLWSIGNEKKMRDSAMIKWGHSEMKRLGYVFALGLFHSSSTF